MQRHFIKTFLLLIVISTSYVYALESINEELIPSFIDEYNRNIENAPKFLIKIFGNERINIYIDNQLFYGFKLENGKITEAADGGIEKPTLNIYATEEVLNKMANGELDPKEALKQGQIDYKGVGFFKKIKYGTLKISSRWFL